MIACEQALRGTLAGVGKKKESLQLQLWNLNICIEKVDAKCWLAEMTLVMTSLPLAHVFPLCADWQKFDSSVNGEPQGNWRWNSNSGDVVASSPSFCCPTTRALWRASSQATSMKVELQLYVNKMFELPLIGFISRHLPPSSPSLPCRQRTFKFS